MGDGGIRWSTGWEFKIVKFLLIGGGRQAKRYLETCAKIKSVEIVGLVTKNDSFVAKASIPVFESLDSALNSCSFNAVISASKPEKQSVALPFLIENRLPSIIEKPIMLSIDKNIGLSLSKRLEKCRDAPFLVNHLHLFHVGYQRFFNQIEHSNVARVEIFEGDFGPMRRFPSLFDWGPHAIGILFHIFGFNWVVDKVSMTVNEQNMGEVWCFDLFLDRSAKKKIEARLVFGNGFDAKKRQIIISYDDGTKLNFDLIKDQISSRLGGNRLLNTILKSQDPMEKLVRFFNSVIQSGVSSWPSESLEISIRATEILHQIYEKRSRDFG